MVKLAIPLFTIPLPFSGVLFLKRPIKVGTALKIGDSIFSISSVFWGWGFKSASPTGNNFKFDRSNPLVVILKAPVCALDMRFQTLFQSVKVVSLNFHFFIDPDHQLVPLLDLGSLVIDGIIDTGQKQADDRGHDQLLILFEKPIGL
jgi:hypothetical protein